jgi:hypothetical protein
MMTGGGMMLGAGLLMMLIVFGLPALLIVGIVAVAWGLLGRRSTPVLSSPTQAAPAQDASAARYCSHCGYGLQPGWTHCPNCGAPASAR